MDDQMLDLTNPGDRIVGRLLQVYGEEHLSPSIAATTRMRMGVMAAAHRRAALIEADATFGAAGETTVALAARRAAAVRNAWRRPVAAVMAGVLTLGILAGTAFAARPGGPLYAARLWTEMANLPADLVGRADAEAHRLDRRIQEALQASTAGDGAATSAALVAYSKIVVEAARGTDKDPAAEATIEGTVTQHVVVLTQMVQNVPAPARAAAEQALTSTTVALDDLDDLDGAGTSATEAQRTGTDAAGTGTTTDRAGRHERGRRPAMQKPAQNTRRPDRAP